MGAASSSARSFARVVTQSFGASSRYRSLGQYGRTRSTSSRYCCGSMARSRHEAMIEKMARRSRRVYSCRNLFIEDSCDGDVNTCRGDSEVQVSPTGVVGIASSHAPSRTNVEFRATAIRNGGRPFGTRSLGSRREFVVLGSVLSRLEHAVTGTRRTRKQHAFTVGAQLLHARAIRLERVARNSTQFQRSKREQLGASPIAKNLLPIWPTLTCAKSERGAGRPRTIERLLLIRRPQAC